MNVYAVPFVKPEQTYVVALFASTTQVAPAGEEITVYPVTADPPFDVGAVKEIVAAPAALLEAVTEVGAPGTVAGVTANEEAEVSDELIPFEAVTANVYAVPLVNPVHE